MGSGWYIVGWNDQILTLVLTNNDELVSNYYAASFNLMCDGMHNTSFKKIIYT